MADWRFLGGIIALGGIIGFLGAKTIDAKKLPAGEKAVLTGASTGATMEGLETLMAAESFSSKLARYGDGKRVINKKTQNKGVMKVTERKVMRGGIDWGIKTSYEVYYDKGTHYYTDNFTTLIRNFTPLDDEKNAESFSAEQKFRHKKTGEIATQISLMDIKNWEKLEAESLKRDSCCCGATKSNPCACMIQGVMECSATCPCSLEN